MTTILLSIIVVAVAVFLLGLRMILTGEKSFRSSHVDDSKALRRRGICCANKQMQELTHRETIYEKASSNQQ